MERWPNDPDDPVDPAFEPLIEAGEGEAEGFEEADFELIEHARHDDQHGLDPILHDAAGFDEPEEIDLDYGEADREDSEEW